MGDTEEGVVRRFYEQVCNGRRNDLVGELFTSDHVMEDPQVSAEDGLQGVSDAVATYQRALNGHWQIEELISSGDQVIARWTGTGTHVGELNGLAPTGRAVRVSAISMHQLRFNKICRTRQVWDTMGLMQQLGVVPGEASRTLQEGYSAFARGDVATVMAMFDPGIEWNTPDTVRFGGTYNGRDGVGEFFGHLAELYDELAVIPDRYIEQGDQVIVRGMISGRPPEGATFQLPFVHCWEFTDGLASRFTEFYDTVRANAALGLAQPIDLSSAVPSQAKGPGASVSEDA